jgi:LysR family transcriptional regulator, regulator for bpeEF and oprC
LPSYLAHAGAPTSLAELAKHSAVLFRVPSTGKDRPWHLRSRGRSAALMPASRLRVDDGDAIVRAAALGMGIGQVPHHVATDLLARAELVELRPAMRPAPMPIAALMPSARLIPARARVLSELLERSADAFPGAPPVNANTSHRRRPRD